MTARSRIVAVAHTGVTVSDLARATRFFSHVLGGTVTPPVTIDDPVLAGITGVAGARITVAYADLPGHRLELLQYLSPRAAGAAQGRPSDPGHIHLAFYVQGIDDLLDRMASAGFAAVGPVQSVRAGPDGPGRVIYTCGFDGIVIELMDHERVR